jgi:hypothetical protein
MNQLISFLIISLVFFEYTFGTLVEKSNLQEVTLLIRLLYREIVYGIILLFIFSKYKDKLFSYNKVLAIFATFYLVTGFFVEASVNHLVLVIPSLILMHYAFFEFKYHQSRISTTLNVVFILNAIMIIMQFLGVSEMVYYHQNFTEDLSSLASFLQTSGYLPNHQHRPHGIFPNSIYLTLFVILYYGHLILSQNNRKIIYIISGLIFPLIGSTTIVLLLSASLFFMRINKKILYLLVPSLVTFMLIYSIFPLFFDMNYNFETFLVSLDVRIDTSKQNSFFTSNLAVSMTFLGVLFIYLVYAFFTKFINSKNSFISYNLFLLFILLLPLAIHPIFLDARYGFLCGMVASFFTRKKIPN